MANLIPNVYPDIQVTEGDATFTYSKEGPKALRTFVLTNLDTAANGGTTAPPSLLWNTVFNVAVSNPGAFDLPKRGSPHPTIVISAPWNTTNSFCADVIEAKAIDSINAKVTVSYQIMNGATQEPSASGDVALALLTTASSVQQQVTSVDNDGNALVAPYVSATDPMSQKYSTSTSTPSTQMYTIYPSGQIGLQPITASATLGNSGPFLPGLPNSRCVANIQVPTTLLRFVRRERTPTSPFGLVGFLNANGGNGWSIPQISATPLDDLTCLCTRIENTTITEGQDYLVTYEFQYAPLQIAPTAPGYEGQIYAGEAAPIVKEDGNNYVSPWAAIGYYQVTGIGQSKVPGGASSQYLQVQNGQIPSDAVPTIFSIYGAYNFQSGLNLPGKAGS
jgi:hypothetical protein